MPRLIAYKGIRLLAQAQQELIAQPQTRLVGHGKKYERFVSYGYLYNWYAVNKAVAEDDDGYSLAPEGWHVPTDAEWTTLTDWIIANSDFTIDTVGNALKSCRQVNSPEGGDCDTSTHPRWDEDATHYGVDEYGFAAIPGGFRFTDGGFIGLGTIGYWWSSTEYSSTYAWLRVMTHIIGNVNSNYLNKTYGFSVRLIRDTPTGWTVNETVVIDGNTYDTVKIGDQVWMVQNLATTKYRNGEDIPNVTDNTDWANDEAGARCAYGNDEDNVFVNLEWL